MNKVKIAILTVSSFLLIGTISCTDKTKGKEILRPVRYEKVSNMSAKQTRAFSGISKSGFETNLSFKVGGTLNYLGVKIGEKVSKNQLIAEIDDSDYQLKYEQSKASEDNAKTQRDLAKSNYKRIEKLYENGNVSVSEYQQSKATYESAKSLVKSIDRQTDQLKKQIGYTKLYAPLDGIVANIFVEKNENVLPGQVIVEFNSGTDPEVRVGLPESYISRVKKGDHVKVTFSSIPGQVFEASIAEVSYVVEQQSSTYPVIARLLNPINEIRPGMAADITFNFQFESENNNLVVPYMAVSEDQGGNFVFVVEKIVSDTAIIHKRSVKVGNLIDENFEILEGLEQNELVVTAGISKLIDGMKVRLLK